MPDDGNGVYSLPAGYLAVTGATVLPSQHNPPLEDIAAALTARLSRSGAAPMLGDLKMGAHKVTGVAAGAADTDAARMDQIGRLQHLPEAIQTDNYTVLIDDTGKALIANKATAITFSLPAVAAAGNAPYLVRNIGAGALTIDPSGAELIEGAATLVLLTGDAALIWPNGNLWRAFKSLVPRDPTPAGIMAPHGSHRVPAGWLKCDATSYLAATYPALFAALVAYSTATITIGTNAAVTWAAHGLVANDPVKFTTTSALPTGLTVGTTYYVSATNLTTNTFCVSATPGGATITTSGTQSGTHTAINAPWGCTNDLLSFNVPEVRGEFLRGLDDGRGIDANRSMGSAQADQNLAHAHGGVVTSIGLGAGMASGSGFAAVGGSTSSSGGTEARPRNVAVPWIIKT
ncbi:phage tail protein [Xanthobacter autotrophicus]|uniref:phage tail protein n=1 Tax=Xanthobacter autotrophicus TaxID=280 RepID=UPI00372B57C2